jgi:GGDEF domain-containing protein
MVGFKPYGASRGQDGQTNALRFMAKMLTTLTRNMGIYECFVAHMGGEHFVVLLNLEDYERFCNTLIDTFDHSIPQLYTPTEISQGYLVAVDRRGAEIRCPLMALSVGVAHTQHRQFKSAKKMFEVLAQVRQMAQPDGKSVVFIDRRRTDR